MTPVSDTGCHSGIYEGVFWQLVRGALCGFFHYPQLCVEGDGIRPLAFLSSKFKSENRLTSMSYAANSRQYLMPLRFEDTLLQVTLQCAVLRKLFIASQCGVFVIRRTAIRRRTRSWWMLILQSTIHGGSGRLPSACSRSAYIGQYRHVPRRSRSGSTLATLYSTLLAFSPHMKSALTMAGATSTPSTRCDARMFMLYRKLPWAADPDMTWGNHIYTH